MVAISLDLNLNFVSLGLENCAFIVELELDQLLRTKDDGPKAEQTYWENPHGALHFVKAFLFSGF